VRRLGSTPGKSNQLKACRFLSGGRASPNALVLRLIVLGYIICAAISMEAATIDWSSAATTTAWSLGTNWVGLAAPANDLTTDIARFDKTSYLNQPNSGTRSISGIQIGDGSTTTAALTLSGTALSIGSSGITMFANAGAATFTATTVKIGANQSWANNSSSLLTINSNITNTGNTTPFTLTLNGSGSGGTTIGGVISNGGTTGTTALTINTTGGTTTLSGANTYTGATSVNGGTLLVNGSTASGSAVTVANSGTVLGGTGTINGTVAVNSSSTINAGPKGTDATSGSVGTLTTGDLTLAGTATFHGDAFGTATSAWDKVIVNGTATLGSATLQLIIASGLTFTANTTYHLIDATSLSGTFNGIADDQVVTFSGYDFIADYDLVNGNFDLIAVPEPSTWTVGALAVLALVWSQRKRLHALRIRCAEISVIWLSVIRGSRIRRQRRPVSAR
jgi:autotransporter-associated beta strand protein